MNDGRLRSRGERKRGRLDLVDEITSELLRMMQVARVPPEDAILAQLLADEAACNANDHGRGATVISSLTVDPCAGRIVILLIYSSAWFDAHQPRFMPGWEPDAGDLLVKGSGRGMRLMRDLTAENGGSARWRFDDPLIYVRLVRRFSPRPRPL